MKSRSKVGRVLSMIALCCSIVYLLLRIFGILDNRMHLTSRYHASAAQSWDTRVLSPQETIGLYGNRFDIVYTGIDNVDQYIPCELVGTWDTPSYWPTLSSDRGLFESGHWDYNNFNPLWFYPSLNQQQINYWSGADYLNRAPFLIYRVYFGDFFYSRSSIAHPNIKIDLPFNYSVDCINWAQMFLFSRDQSARDSGWSWCQHTFTLNSTAITQMVASNDGHGQSVVTPFPQYVDSEDGINMGMISLELGSLLASDTWNYSKQTLYLNGCDVYETFSENQSFLLYVQCPKITTNYFPPIPETTQPIVTTRPDFTTPIFTYDLSPLETNQINQIRIQNEQLQVEYAQLQGINYICWKLDQIYNEMVDRGEIPVDLIPGSPVELYNSDVRNEINGILTSYTTSQLPDYEYEMDFVSRAFSFLWAESWIAALGGLSLCFSVAAWIIFEGRRG